MHLKFCEAFLTLRWQLNQNTIEKYKEFLPRDRSLFMVEDSTEEKRVGCKQYFQAVKGWVIKKTKQGFGNKNLLSFPKHDALIYGIGGETRNTLSAPIDVYNC